MTVGTAELTVGITELTADTEEMKTGIPERTTGPIIRMSAMSPKEIPKYIRKVASNHQAMSVRILTVRMRAIPTRRGARFPPSHLLIKSLRNMDQLAANKD